MKVRLRLRWPRTRKLLVVLGLLVALVVVIALIIAVVLSNGTGFDGYTKVTTAHVISGPNAGTVTRTEEYQTGKALWDWLQLLIIPAVLAIGGYLFSFTTSSDERKAADRHNQTEREIAQDNQHEAVLQGYIDKMSELLLEKNLRSSNVNDEVRKVARVRTLTVLLRLDKVRKKSLLQFLHEAGLINKDDSIVELSGADLIGADLGVADLGRDFLDDPVLSKLRGVNLSEANLSEVVLREADLSNANLSGADLRGNNMLEAKLGAANLSGANLSRTLLSEADLSDVDLSKANLYEAYLDRTDLRGADLRGADLASKLRGKADLSGADLSKANLSGAKVSTEQLATVKSLKGATMPDGKIIP